MNSDEAYATSLNISRKLMLRTALKAEKIHGLFFDGATLLGNIAFFGFLPTLEDEVNPTFAGAILLVAVVTQMTGAWWKKGFLTQRLARRTQQPARGFARGFMNFLLFFHFLLFTVITLFALAQLGIYDFGESGTFIKGDVWVVVSLLVGALTTFLVISAEQYEEENTNRVSSPSWLEFGADGLLWVSVGIVTRTFWDSLIKLIEPSSGIGISSKAIVLLVAMSILYMFFYLPSRYLFLVEDYQHVLTWFQIWAAMLPVVWLVIIG